MRQKSTKNISQQQSNLEMFPKLTEQNLEKSTSLLSDSHAKIYQLLENEPGYKVAEAVYSLKRHGLLGSADPIFLSLKTSKGFYQATTEKTLKSFCEKLPTLGFMSANGNLSILLGYYPKIESGYTLSGILQEASEVDEKYFLSEKSVKKLMEYNDRQEKNGRGFRAEFPTEREIKSALKVGGGYKDDLVSVTKNLPQALRVRNTKTNAVTIGGEGGGQGAKTGLYEVRAVLTPDRQEKRRNGRRMKANGEDSFTLTSQDKHGVAINKRIRRLTPCECARLQGFPDDWCKDVSDSQQYRCYGNAVTVDIVKLIAERLKGTDENSTGISK